jgi:hypothetical protein
MKKFINLLLFLTVVTQLHSQELKFAFETSTPLDKKLAKKGLYAGTYLNNDQIDVIYYMSSDKSGVQLFQYDFDNNLKLNTTEDISISDSEAREKYDWYVPQADVEKYASKKNRFLEANRTLIGAGMNIKYGHIEFNYNQGIFVDWKFVSEGKIKPKKDGIWKIFPAGYKTTSDYTKLQTAYGFSEDLEKSGIPLLAPSEATLLGVGVITDKVSVKNPPLTNFNRIAAITVTNENFDAAEMEEYLLPYSAAAMGSGLGQNDDLCAVFAPRNAPSTLKAHKPLQWKDRKDEFTFMRFSDDRKLVDSLRFKGKIMHGDFNIFNTDNSSMIVAFGDTKHNGWGTNTFYQQLKKVNGVQFVKIKDDKLIYNVMFDEDQIEDKLQVPAGEKKKLVMEVTFGIIDIINLPNGDDMVIGRNMQSTFAYQVSSNGELRAVYQIGRIDDKKSQHYNIQYKIVGNDIYLVPSEQPTSLSNDTQVKVSSSSITAGGMKTTTTTTTVKRLNEVYVQAQVVKIDFTKASMSNKLVINGKDYYAMGSYPAFFTPDGIIFTGKKGPKGKELFVSKINY